ncbi:MAG: hypothetical protein QOG10_6879 [Kribbellaceae bacterium]|jgi:hypothetical protein|nr:hypothetical protein [Kribbellaceae bacterium]
MRAVFYVDGFNLYHGLRAKHGRRYHWLDLQALAQLMRQHDEVLAVRYFTAIVKGEPDAARRQEIYLGALAQHCPAVTIHRGHFKPKTPRGCRHCGEPWQCQCDPPTRYRTYEEKLTDVALASALLEDTATGFGDLTVVVSTDTDFTPAIDAALRIAPARPLYLACPPGRVSPRNLNPGVTPFLIPDRHLQNAQLPTQVASGPGRPAFTRPAKWSANNPAAS